MTSEKESLLTFELANHLFRYREDGRLIWKHPHQITKTGKVAGGQRKDGRWQVMLRLAGKSYLFLAYRIVWLLHNREWPVNTVDHINTDHTDDRIENLRDVSSKGNNENRMKPLSNNRSGELGVSPFKNKFRASIGVSNELGIRTSVHLGVFDTIEAAKDAYLSAKSELHLMR